MALSDKNPAYGEFLPDWELMRDAYKGERRVKSKTVKYLPATTNQILDGFGKSNEAVGQKDYTAYLTRARFPNFVREAVQMAIGMLHSQPPQIELPEAMQGIRGTRGETMEQLLRAINTEQLVVGRIGLLADLPTSPSATRDTPYIALYNTETLINWDDGSSNEVIPQSLNVVVLDETEEVRGEGLSWVSEEKHRVLMLGAMGPNESEGQYRYGVFEEGNDFTGFESLKAPSWRGRTLNKIPFVIINSCDVYTDPDEPPLLDLGNLCMTIYRGEADYRQNLFMQGQDTLVTIGLVGEDGALRTGAGVSIEIPMGGDAKYIGVTSDGLSEQREALESDRRRAGSMGAQTLDTTSRERESGASLHIRMAARTADLRQIAMAGAKGLEDLLKICAEWMGENPDEVKVSPNLEFGDERLTGQSMVEMATARNQGFPVSARTLHRIAYDRGITEMTWEEEMKAAEEEKDTPFAKALEANGDQNPDQSGDEAPAGKDQSGKPKEQTGVTN